MSALILVPMAVILGVYVMAVALCRAAARGDRMAEQARWSTLGARHGLDTPLHRKGRRRG